MIEPGASSKSMARIIFIIAARVRAVVAKINIS